MAHLRAYFTVWVIITTVKYIGKWVDKMSTMAVKPEDRYITEEDADYIDWVSRELARSVFATAITMSDSQKAVTRFEVLQAFEKMIAEAKAKTDKELFELRKSNGSNGLD